MKKLLLVLVFASSLFGQAFRFDPSGATMVSPAYQPGTIAPLLVLPNSKITLCGYPATGGVPCTNLATSYTDATGGTACGPTTPVVPAAGGGCTAYTDASGNFGFWLQPGNYTYVISVNGGNYGPYPISVGSGAATGFVNVPNFTGIAKATSGSQNLTLATNTDILALIGILPIGQGGTGSASPTLNSGTSTTISGTWPFESVNVTPATSSQDGSVRLPSGGTSEILGSLASQVQQTMNVNVKEWPYNAAGDGTTDDTAHIAAACADAKAINGVLYFPAGNYSTDTITCIDSFGLTFAGEGPQSSILTSRFGRDVISISTGNQVHSIILRDFGINGGGGTGNIGINTSASFPYLFEIQRVTIATDGQCILMPTNFTTVIDKVLCASTSSNGIEVSGDNTTMIENSYVSRIGATGQAAYVVYGGQATLLNNNALNSVGGSPIPNSSWAIIGRSTADGDPSTVAVPTAYVSGGSLTGTSWCLLTSANGGGTGGQIYLYTSGGSFASFIFATGGSGYTSQPTSWTWVKGTACSGTVTTSGGTIPPFAIASVNFIGNNIEDFGKLGVWTKGGSMSNYYGDTFLAYAGTTTKAILFDTSPPQGIPVIDSTTTFNTIGAWANGYAIHGGFSCPLFDDKSRNSTANTSGSCYVDNTTIVYQNDTTTRNASLQFATAVPSHLTLQAVNGMWANKYISSGTTFTATGCSAGTFVGGSSAGSLVSGTTGTCTVVVTLPSAPHGWACSAHNLTTTANAVAQTATGTASATLSGTTVSGDILNFGCEGY